MPLLPTAQPSLAASAPSHPESEKTKQANFWWDMLCSVGLKWVLDCLPCLPALQPSCTVPPWAAAPCPAHGRPASPDPTEGDIRALTKEVKKLKNVEAKLKASESSNSKLQQHTRAVEQEVR